MLRAELIDDAEELEALAPAWDELAAGRGLPFSTAGWLLPWWRHAAPDGAELRVAVAFDGHEPAGIAPFFATRGPGGSTAYRLLGSQTSVRMEPLARPGVERAAADAFAAVLADADPRPALLELEGISTASPWPGLLAEAWPGGPAWTRVELRMPSPTLSLAGTFEDWLSAKGRHFRQRMSQARRRLEEAGATAALAEGEQSVSEGLESFARLHHARWADRGGSGVLNARVELMLSEAFRALGEGRAQLWTLRVGGAIVAVELLIAAGGEVADWLGGFDEAWARLQPSTQLMLAAIEHAFESGERRFDLGAGGQDYKYRFADGEDTLLWHVLVPRGRRSLATRGRLLPRQLRRGAAQRLTAGQKRAVKKLLRIGR